MEGPPFSAVFGCEVVFFIFVVSAPSVRVLRVIMIG